MNSKLLALLKSRRFLVAVVGVAAVVSSDVFGVKLDTEQVIAVASIAIAWIVGDSVRETK